MNFGNATQGNGKNQALLNRNTDAEKETVLHLLEQTESIIDFKYLIWIFFNLKKRKFSWRKRVIA